MHAMTDFKAALSKLRLLVSAGQILVVFFFKGNTIIVTRSEILVLVEVRRHHVET